VTGNRIAVPRRARVSRALLRSLGLIGLAMTIGLFVLFDIIITRSFTAMEDREIAAHLARIEDFKQSQLKSMDSRSKDWAIWDDTNLYARNFNAAYEASNLNASSFTNAQVDGQVVVQYATGEMRSHAFDRRSQQPDPELARALADFVGNSGLPAMLRRKEVVQAFVTLRGLPYVLGAANIHRSDGGGAAPGYLVFATRLESAQASQALQVPASFALGKAAPEAGIVKSRSQVRITAPVADFSGRPIGAISLKVGRPLLAAASELLTLAFACVVFVVFAMLAMLHWRARRLVLAPLESLHRHLETIRLTGELTLLDAPVRQDEFGAVQAEFNAMAGELQDLRARVESQSFALGRSQSAVGLMHNLRNCLSPVRVILDMLEREIAAPMSPHVSRALEELASPATEQVRREKLAQFVTASFDQHGAHGASNQQNVREAARNLMNAFAAIDSAQAEKDDTRFDERCDVSSMLSHASNIVRFSDGLAVDVDIRAAANVVAQGNRVLLSQVIENLVANALEAVRESGRTDGTITLEAATDESAGMCRIVVSDNGGGFDPAIGPQLFERGFSTRKSRSGGLGLHWCANTVKAMGGQLSLASDGVGRGASATIDLAIPTPEARDSAIAA